MVAEPARLSCSGGALRRCNARCWTAAGLGRDAQTIDDVARAPRLTATKVTAAEHDALVALRAVFGIPDSAVERPCHLLDAPGGDLT